MAPKPSMPRLFVHSLLSKRISQAIFPTRVVFSLEITFLKRSERIHMLESLELSPFLLLVPTFAAVG
jgi:hypothetical protein